jgi:hypothetical protein
MSTMLMISPRASRRAGAAACDESYGAAVLKFEAVR